MVPIQRLFHARDATCGISINNIVAECGTVSHVIVSGFCPSRGERFFEQGRYDNGNSGENIANSKARCVPLDPSP